MEISVLLTTHWVTSEKPLNIMKKGLQIAKEIGDRAEEGRAYHNFGKGYFNIGQFDNAVNNFVSAVDVFNTLRSQLKSEDIWKIKFREIYSTTYTSLWRSLLRIGKINEALVAADQERAQTLSDNLLIHYKLAAPLSSAPFDPDEKLGFFTLRGFYTNYLSRT